MKLNHRFYLFFTMIILSLFVVSNASAFLGFGDSSKKDKSGLDLVQGYDRNTVVKITGIVAVPPQTLVDDIMSLELNLSGERIIVILGPQWYFSDDKLEYKVGDNVTVRGSIAQGKDGRTYLISQQITTPEGKTILLREETGKPLWTHSNRSTKQGSGSGMQRRGSGGHRGR